MTTIHKTKNYDQFKIFPHNRPISPNTLIESLSKENMLHLHPIVVNKDMYIIDGQHRHYAAKKLGLELYYVIDESTDGGESHIGLSQVQKPWSLADWLHYTKDRHISFRTLYDIVKKYPALSVKTIIEKSVVQTGSRGGSSANHVLFNQKSLKFRPGKDKESIEIMCERLSECQVIFTKTVKNYRFSREQLQTLWEFFELDEFDYESFMKRVKNYPELVKEYMNYRTASSLRECLTKIYNKGRRENKIEIGYNVE